MNFNTLTEQIRAYCDREQISMTLRVTRCDRIEYELSCGYADLASKTPFDRHSMFSFYSLSKPFCAIGLLKLRDRGLVDIDAHPSKYLPEAKGFDERVTIRHLLHHTSGLPDFEQCTEFCSTHKPGYARFARAHLRELSALPSCFAPGTSARYANVNFVIPALIVENITGLPYSEYMKREVFDPLGMNCAVVDDEGRVIPNRVKCYELDGDHPVEVNRSLDWMLGAGDIVGTVDDVYCLNRAIKHRLLLRPETWQEVLTPSPLNGMGMGCTVGEWHGAMRIQHNGGHTGFRTLHIQIPADDFDIILLSNSGYGSARPDLSSMVHDAFYGSSNAPLAPMDTGYIKSV
ncbi:MAG: beta-lactamase family protein [Ruminococcaceae bacterium]|nr:beta-lactamase family protein [Oscillospiraceae bacterium]